MCLGSFDRALQLADDASAADVWYNLSQVRVAVVARASLVICVLGNAAPHALLKHPVL